MSAYKNAADILPDPLLRAVQEYIEGELLYVPVSRPRRGWGERSGTRDAIALRNREICARYLSGDSLEILAGTYHLSVETLRKIVRKRE